MAYIYNMVDTWNASGTTYTGIGLNVTDTASASGSLLMDLQIGGSSKFSVRKDGLVNISGASGLLSFGAGADAILSRRAAANLQFGAADAAAPVAQTLSVQSVVAGTTNTAGANLTITGSQGTGTGGGGTIIFQVALAGSSGSTQNTLSTAMTIENNTNVTFANAVIAGATSYIGIGSTRARLLSPADSILRLSNSSQGDFDRLQFGGTTSSFPALKRSTTSLQARLADDSAFTNIQGKLTTDTAYAAGTVVPTGVLTLYDSTGTAYRVPCLV